MPQAKVKLATPKRNERPEYFDTSNSQVMSTALSVFVNAECVRNLNADAAWFANKGALAGMAGPASSRLF